jgi:hypothetical protein
MRISDFKANAFLKAAVLVASILLFGASSSFAQQQVNLTAAPTTSVQPDGTPVPMWGYFCGPLVTTSTATCAALNPLSAATTTPPITPATWSPVVITVPAGQSLTINLTNNLSFTPTGSTTANTIPTSIVIVGQVGGGLGGAPTTTLSPDHSLVQGCETWFIASGAIPPGVPCPAQQPGASGIPPMQGPRVQSMGTEVEAVVAGSTATCTAATTGTVTGCAVLTWKALKPGTYLLESGTHPSIQVPMGLIGILVVTTAPVPSTTAGVAGTAGIAYPAVGTAPAVPYNAEVPLEFSEIDPVLNKNVNIAVNSVGFSETKVWSGMPGQCGNPSSPVGVVNTCYPPAVNYTPFYYLINGVAFDKNSPGASLFPPTAGVSSVTVAGVTTTTPVTTGIAGTVLVRLVNAGVRMHVPSMVGSQTLGFSGAGVASTVSGFTLIAEDGNPLPNLNAPRVQTDVFMAAGKTFDVMIDAPVGGIATIALATGGGGTGYCSGCLPTAGTGTLTVTISGGGGTGATATATVVGGVIQAINITNAGSGYTAQPTVTVTDNGTAGTGFAAGTAALVSSVGTVPVYDRELSLSANSSVRDAGMLAYIGVNGAGLPVTAGTGVFATAKANPDTYNSMVPGQPFTVSDPSKGVIANDVNVYGATLLMAPTSGTITCTLLGSVPGLCANGTFTYTPNTTSTATSDSFTYCANNGHVAATTTTAASCPTNLTAMVTLGASALSGSPMVNNVTYTSKMSTFLKIPSPGVLSVDSDPSNLSLSVAVSSVSIPPCTNPVTAVCANMDPNGGFTASAPGAGSYTFTYVAQNSQGRQSSAATVTLIFPAPSNLNVNVLDAQAYNNCNGNSACISTLTPFPDYRWIIEEDKTFWVDPNCTANSSISTPGCPAVVGPSGTSSTVPSFGVNFHTSSMEFVAQGCTGPLSCEGGQTMLDTRPACTSAGVPTGCSATAGQHIFAICDVGNGACRPDPNQSTGSGSTYVMPSQVALDPAKRYYISVLPGDAANPFPAYTGQPVCPANGAENLAITDTTCGHTMSGAPIQPACNILGGPKACTTTSAFAPVNVLVLPTPLPTGKLSVIVFEDDYPLNGEQDGGGGNGTIAPIEPGLGGFNLVLWDTYGGLGDVTGQDTYDDFNQPLSNSLSGTIDPVSGLDACPVSANATQAPPNSSGSVPTGGVTGVIVTCPKYESDGTTLSPLAGQAVIDHLMPEKFSVQAYPGADRIARGEQWVQTNTLDGQHPHDSFIRIGEPSYFQEYGPAGYHVNIGFANPAIINARAKDVCAGAGTPGTVGPCTNIIDGQVDVERLSRTPDQRLYPSGSRAALAWTQCWVSLGDPDGEDFQFTFCDANGNFKFTNVPGGSWRLSIGDQWNDQIIDGLSTPANVGCTSTAPNGTNNATTCPGGQTLHMGTIGTQQWQANLYTRTFIDDNKNGIWDPNEIGIPFIYTMIRYRDGHTANNLVTDFNGIANFNETYPLFNWYVVEADSGRYKTTGIHTVYDAGGPADHSPSCLSISRPCGTSTAYSYLTNTYESVPLPADLSVPGAVYCAAADCMTEAASFAAGTAIPSSSTSSTGRIDPPTFGGSEGFSGLTGLSNWIDIGKAPYASCPPACATVPSSVVNSTAGGTTASMTQVAENGGIHGEVAYASTRPFDDASQMIQQPWEPMVPHVTLNLYQEGFAADGVTPTLTVVDTTQSSSWDDWAQGFYPNYTDPTTGTPLPYMSCPGQGTNVTGSPNQDLFFFTLFDQPNYLDWYNSVHNGGTLHSLPYNSQYKCYDAMHIGNQLQPAPYDGKYSFPSSLGINPATGKLLAVKGATNGVASNMNGTNCTICVANPDTTDAYRVGTPMLPPGKYVVQVIMPPGYEVYKEEDKNLLIGDNFISPVTQEFAGLGADIFIIPDQASVASLYDESGAGYNPNNYQDQTSSLGLSDELSGVPGFPGFQDPLWPCVGEMRVVPDYLSLFPQAKEDAPFAGATRPLCDRKEVTLQNQMSVSAKFYIFTSTHIASKFAGGITDDYTSEFDPFAPQFGEKFSPPNMPVSTKDYLGNELSRVYSDHWGTYDGLTFSSWEVNPPNITGYSPSMMVQCMNDPGPILDTNPSSPTYGQMITDPLFNPAYSNFCYEIPFMPGLTTYNDTPVVPTEAFVGAAYNSPDCSYPDATPAIKEVDGTGIGPWVSASGVTLTITGLGDTTVPNSAYSGPSANTAPFNLKTITRHYGFGNQCLGPIVGSTTCNTLSSVTIGGKPAVVNSWTDSQIQVTVPTGVPNCAVQQQAQYGGSTAQCGQLVITAGNGKQSIDTVTVTIRGKMPIHVNANDTIQGKIDAALPGDLIIVDPTCTTTGTTVTAPCSTTVTTQTKSTAAHSEMLLMWKPVRLQGVGAVSSIIDANANPAGKLLNPWRRHVNCLFGLTLDGVPVGSTAATGGTPATYDPTGTYNCPDTGWNPLTWTGSVNNPQIDRLPLEATVGWDATQNGNLAEQLQEPSLMGAYEGAGITVLGKGVDFHGANPWSDGNEGGAFPTGSTLLVGVGPDPTALPVGDANPLCHTSTTVAANPFPSNFACNPSSIDGLTIRDTSQGGGGIFAHGWGHYLQIANNRVYNNAGTLTGGISVGQGEFPTPYVQGSTTNAAPGSCSDGTGFVTNQHLPYCLQVKVDVHNNSVTGNSSLGDELFSGTLSGGGGASFCTGNDYYKFNYNWVCGNLSSAEGGGLVHLGEIQNGDIEHNSFVLNQSTNPTIPTNGGGIHVMGTPDTDPVCGTALDADCPPGLSDGSGHGLTINANLIQANAAESGSGGGIRLQQVNGTEVSFFPTQPNLWNSVSITNNMIVNNQAGWDGAGISLEDALNVSIINNTISSNDTLASSGVLTQSIGTPDASAPAGSCTNAAGTASCPQSAGVTSTQHSPAFATSISGLTLTCPNGQSGCQGFSNPLLQNNVIWENRAFYIGIGNLGQGPKNQQNLVSLFDAFTGTAAPVQTASGQCSSGVSYWDIGVRGDTGPANHGSGFTLNPTYSALDDPADYPGGSNLGSNPNIVGQYCDGSRVPPNCTVADGCGGPSGYGVPPGIVDASSPNPLFSLTPSATVDEGNNWINVSWGPLALSDDSLTGGANGNYGGGAPFANYVLVAGSPAIDYVPINTTTFPAGTVPALNTDFFGNPRPDPSNTTHFDVGAVEFQGTGGAQGGLISITPDTGYQGTVVNVTITGTGLTGATAVNVAGVGGGGGNGITVSNFLAVSATTVTATFTIAPNATVGARNVTVTAAGGNTLGPVTFSVVLAPAPTLTSIVPNTELRGTSVNVTLTGTNFTSASTINVEGVTGFGTGFSVAGVTVVSSTSITATFSSTNAAALGAKNIYVGTAGGSSNTVPFTITGPVLTSITPASGLRGIPGTPNPIAITLTGTGLTGTTSVNVSGNGVSVSGMTVVNDTTITATFAFSPGATAGARNVTTTGPGGTSNALTFTVTVPPAGLFSIAPNTGARGTSETVTLTGITLTGATSVNVSGGGGGGGGVTVPAFTVVNDTTITATFTVSATAALTARNVTVTTPTGTTTPVTFTVVLPGTPTLASIAPASGVRGTPHPVVLIGTGFTAAGTTVHVTAPANGLTITGVTVVSSTQINATFNTSGAATIGPREIFATTPGGSTGTVTYTVGGPVLDSISPTEAVRGTTVPVSLFGSGLTGTTAINVSGPGGGGGGSGITVSAITVASDQQVNATFTISPTATGAARNVTVTAPGGTSNATPFTVIALPAPTLASIAPNTGVRGTSVAVTLTGTNFTGATAVTVSGGGVACSGITVLDPETAMATCAIMATASTTAVRNVSISTGSGASTQTVPFTVQGPTLTSISPNAGARGTTVSVTFTGTNLQTSVAGTTTVTGLGGGITLVAGSVSVVNSTTVTASLVISAGATLGGIHNIDVSTPIGTTNTVPFTVTGATVAISAPTPTLTPATANTVVETGTVTVSNAAAATGPLTLTAAPTVTKVGGAGGTFAVTGGTCTTGTAVAPGGSCTIIVQYTPPTTGTITATATAHVIITGSGIAAATMTSANFTAN